MTPLADLIVLLFVLLVALAATTWLTLTARERAARTRETHEDAPARAERRPRRSRVGRGVRREGPAAEGRRPVPPGEEGASVRPRRAVGEDPFERFLDPDRRRRRED